MKTLASLIFAVSLSLPFISTAAADDLKDLLPLPAVPHTTLDATLTVVVAGVSLDFGVPELVAHTGLDAGENMKGRGDRKNQIVAYAKTSGALPLKNIQWHNVADIKSVTDNA